MLKSKSAMSLTVPEGEGKIRKGMDYREGRKRQLLEINPDFRGSTKDLSYQKRATSSNSKARRNYSQLNLLRAQSTMSHIE